jgi:hypothetical protein
MANASWQIGFLTEWQMYAQKLEGDSWIGEKMDPAKIEKMSGMLAPCVVPPLDCWWLTAEKISSSVRCMSSCRRYGTGNLETTSNSKKRHCVNMYRYGKHESC